MNKDLRDFYEEQKYKVEKEIEALREVNKKSKAKENRLFEIDLILTGLEAKREIDRLYDKIGLLELRLKMEGINIDE